MAPFKIIDVLKPVDYETNSERYRKISVVVVSDTHKNHDKTEIPHGDIFLHCGDFTKKSCWRSLTHDDEIPQSMIDFNQWLGRLPHRHKFVICGNHELGFSKLSKEEIESKYLTNCIYLKDELIEVEGITIYGCSWSFTEDYRTKWSSSPSHIDILMTHTPPQFVLDLTLYKPHQSPSKEPCLMCNNVVHIPYGHWGSQSLRKEIYQRIQPRVHCFGHVHDDAGYKYDHDISTLFINAAADLTNQSFKFSFYVDLHKQ